MLNMMVAIMQQLTYFNKIYLQVNTDCFNFVPNNQNIHKMEDEVILRINKKNQEAKLLLAYLASLPYVEVQEEEEPNEVTKQALRDAWEGKTFKAKNADDLMAQLLN